MRSCLFRIRSRTPRELRTTLSSITTTRHRRSLPCSQPRCDRTANRLPKSRTLEPLTSTSVSGLQYAQLIRANHCAEPSDLTPSWHLGCDRRPASTGSSNMQAEPVAAFLSGTSYSLPTFHALRRPCPMFHWLPSSVGLLPHLPFLSTSCARAPSYTYCMLFFFYCLPTSMPSITCSFSPFLRHSAASLHPNPRLISTSPTS